MRGSACWRVTAVLLALLTSGHSSAHPKPVPQQQHAAVNATQHPAGVMRASATPPERWRRSALQSDAATREQRAASTAALLSKLDPMGFAPVRGRRTSLQALRERSTEEKPFWAARGKRLLGLKDSGLSLLGSSEESPFWAARGKRLLESEEENPFWAARGKKLMEILESAENPFWSSKKCPDIDPRGKKLLESQENPFWAARGKKFEEFLESGENPFWAARGKKLSEFLESDENPFWAARGKKLLAESEENPFWAARGKKLLVESEENPFWAARGKKLLVESGENPFWAARGKKLLVESGENPFWAARGKKMLVESGENPFWAARGKKMLETVGTPYFAPKGKKSESKEVVNSKENPFWASRGRRGSLNALLSVPGAIKRTENAMLSVMKPRANRQGLPSNSDQFWPVRGKRLNKGFYDDAEFNKEDEQFWQKLENKTALFGEKSNTDTEAFNIQEILGQIFGIPTENSNMKQKKKHYRELILNPNYSTSFWSSRG